MEAELSHTTDFSKQKEVSTLSTDLELTNKQYKESSLGAWKTQESGKIALTSILSSMTLYLKNGSFPVIMSQDPQNHQCKNEVQAIRQLKKSTISESL